MSFENGQKYLCCACGMPVFVPASVGSKEVIRSKAVNSNDMDVVQIFFDYSAIYLMNCPRCLHVHFRAVRK